MTEQIKITTQLKKQTFHNKLTNLPNHTLLLKHLTDTLHRWSHHNQIIKILFLNLNHFKIINDSLNHNTNDNLLQKITRHLKQTVQPNNTITRLKNNKFIIIIDNIIRTTNTLLTTEQIRATITHPIILNNKSTVMTTNLKITITFKDKSPKNLLHDTNTTIYQTKKHNHDQTKIFDNQLRTQTIHRHSIKQEVQTTLKNKQIKIHFQPIIRITNKIIIKTKTLTRIQNQTNNLLHPTQFINITKNNNLITKLKNQILALSLKQLAT